MTVKIIAVEMPNISIPSAASSGPINFQGVGHDYIAIAEEAVVHCGVIERRGKMNEFPSILEHQRPDCYLYKVGQEREQRTAQLPSNSGG